MIYEYFPFTYEDVPVKMVVTIDGKAYTYLIEYNESMDFYTLKILKDDEVIYSAKLLYGNDCLHAVKDICINRRIIPYDAIGLFNRIEKDNFGKKVKLYAVI